MFAARSPLFRVLRGASNVAVTWQRGLRVFEHDGRRWTEWPYPGGAPGGYYSAADAPEQSVDESALPFVPKEVDPNIELVPTGIKWKPTGEVWQRVTLDNGEFSYHHGRLAATLTVSKDPREQLLSTEPSTTVAWSNGLRLFTHNGTTWTEYPMPGNAEPDPLAYYSSGSNAASVYASDLPFDPNAADPSFKLVQNGIKYVPTGEIWQREPYEAGYYYHNDSRSVFIRSADDPALQYKALLEEEEMKRNETAQKEKEEREETDRAAKIALREEEIKEEMKRKEERDAQRAADEKAALKAAEAEEKAAEDRAARIGEDVPISESAPNTTTEHSMDSKGEEEIQNVSAAVTAVPEVPLVDETAGAGSPRPSGPGEQEDPIVDEDLTPEALHVTAVGGASDPSEPVETASEVSSSELSPDESEAGAPVPDPQNQPEPSHESQVQDSPPEPGAQPLTSDQQQAMARAHHLLPADSSARTLSVPFPPKSASELEPHIITTVPSANPYMFQNDYFKKSDDTENSTLISAREAFNRQLAADEGRSVNQEPVDLDKYPKKLKIYSHSGTEEDLSYHLEGMRGVMYREAARHIERVLKEDRKTRERLQAEEKEAADKKPGGDEKKPESNEGDVTKLEPQKKDGEVVLTEGQREELAGRRDQLLADARGSQALSLSTALQESSARHRRCLALAFNPLLGTPLLFLPSESRRNVERFVYNIMSLSRALGDSYTMREVLNDERSLAAVVLESQREFRNIEADAKRGKWDHAGVKDALLKTKTLSHFAAETHSAYLFWNGLRLASDEPQQEWAAESSALIRRAIEARWGDYQTFVNEFLLNVDSMMGTGYVWLVYMPLREGRKRGKLKLFSAEPEAEEEVLAITAGDNAEPEEPAQVPTDVVLLKNFERNAAGNVTEMTNDDRIIEKLVMLGEDGETTRYALNIITTLKSESPLTSGYKPILGVDMSACHTSNTADMTDLEIEDCKLWNIEPGDPQNFARRYLSTVDWRKAEFQLRLCFPEILASTSGLKEASACLRQSPGEVLNSIWVDKLLPEPAENEGVYAETLRRAVSEIRLKAGSEGLDGEYFQAIKDKAKASAQRAKQQQQQQQQQQAAPTPPAGQRAFESRPGPAQRWQGQSRRPNLQEGPPRPHSAPAPTPPRSAPRTASLKRMPGPPV